MTNPDLGKMITLSHEVRERIVNIALALVIFAVLCGGSYLLFDAMSEIVLIKESQP